MERAIKMRSIDGESITVSIDSDRSIHELKDILRQTFLPARKSPNFHIFFRGERLSLSSRIDSHHVNEDDFMVLVPFVKKSRKEYDAPTGCPEPVVASDDSSWRDIMDDISSLSEFSKTEKSESSSSLPDDMLGKGENTLGGDIYASVYKNRGQKRKLGNDHALHDMLCFDFENLFDKQTSEKISRYLESLGCLSNRDVGSCFLFEGYFKATGMSEQCVCPSWLRKAMKNFTFINILYAPFQRRRECLTWDCIKEAIDRHNIFGLETVSITDVEYLSIICPAVVCIIGINDKYPIKSGSTVVIGTSPDYLHKLTGGTVKKRVSTSILVSDFWKRTLAFEVGLWKSIKCLVERRLSNSMPLTLPLDDHILMEDVNKEVREVGLSKTRSSELLCDSLQAMDPAEMVEHLKKGLGKHGQIVHVEQLCAKEAVYKELSVDLSETVKATLKVLGITRLYSHQADAIRSSLSGANVVVATTTSSGKSLCYNVPVITTLTHCPLSCALYIFPTKALAQDQLRVFSEMTKDLNVGLNIGVYDGDTAQSHRTWIRDNARLVISNPDMLHVSILPNHRKFYRILSNLRYIVVDETHVYKGAFGCHTAMILRRLCRICSREYSTNPTFIFSTATSANPREHAMELGNLQNLQLIQNDGSPCGPKYFVLWNPPLRSGFEVPSEKNGLVKSDITRRSSSIVEVSHLLAEMVRHRLRCIAFCKTRKLCELVVCYTREILMATAKDLVDSICVYRAGYTPQDRRKIEADLVEGRLWGVAATNALELGIDIGYIDGTLHLGFPGSVASLWQQAGRSGRRGKPSLAVYVAFDGPLDQYFMKFPHKLFGTSIELCQVDSQNEKVLEQHIACAAFELPLCLNYDEKFFGSGLDRAIVALRNKGCLANNSGVCLSNLWHYIGPEKHPSHAISIRVIETNKYQVIDQSTSSLLEEIEESKAFFQVYEGAVYMNQGLTYMVTELDLSAKVALCQKADVKYFTKTRDYTDIEVIGGDLAYQLVKSEIGLVSTTARASACIVTTRWFGFHRIWRSTNRIFESVDLTLPSYSYESQAAWIRVPPSVKIMLEAKNNSFRAGLHAASHAVLNVVPLYVMCNVTDLGTVCANPHETRAFAERILLYDRHPGGIGITSQVKLLFGELLTAAFELVSSCSCLSTTGCPNCVQVMSCSEYNEVLDKHAAKDILKGVIDAERTYFRGAEYS